MATIRKQVLGQLQGGIAAGFIAESANLGFDSSGIIKDNSKFIGLKNK